MKRIGVLTSGGDAQGMNAAVFAVVRYAIKHGLEVYGIDLGYKGLIEGRVHKLSVTDVDYIIHRGGSILKTARCLEMLTPEGQQRAVKTLKDNKIEGLVIIGGDGSFRGARLLSVEYGINTIGIPGTIDNDLPYTEFTLGFDSAVNKATTAITALRDTMSCNDRTCVVEVMGRNCGDIALYSGLSTGSEIIIVPEVPVTMDEIAARLMKNISHGKMDNIIVMAEGVGRATNFYRELEVRIPGLNIRPMIVGHLQRGGDASLRDRMLGVRMGTHAVQCLLDGVTGSVIGIRNNEIFHEDIVEALKKERPFNMELYNLANSLVESY